MAMSTVSDMFPSKYYKGDDFANGPAIRKVTAVTVETLRTMDGGNKQALVLGFEQEPKHLVLNKTMAMAMVDITGTEHFEKWPGTSIKLSRAIAPNNKPTVKISPAPRPRPIAPAEAAAEPVDDEELDDAADSDEYYSE